MTVDTTNEASEEPLEPEGTAGASAQAPTEDSPLEALAPLNPLFRLVIFVSAAFLVTVLIMLASVFSDGKSPVFVWFNKNAVTLIIVEVVLIVVASVSAMAFDKTSTEPDEAAADKD